MSGDGANLIQNRQNANGENEEGGFKSIPTLPIALFQLLATVGTVIAAWLVPTYLDAESNPSSVPVLLYIQAGLWIFHLLGYSYTFSKHEESRLNGYLDFHPVLSKWGKIPLLIVSVVKVLLVVVLGVLWDNCHEIETCTDHVHLTPVHYIQLIITLEGLLVIITTIPYIVHVWQFNRLKPLPDVYQEEAMHESFRTFQDTAHSERSPDDLLEKQAETIHYLKEHNSILNAKVLALTHQLNHVEHA